MIALLLRRCFATSAPDLRRLAGWLLVGVGAVFVGYQFEVVRKLFYSSRPPIWVVIGPLLLSALYARALVPLMPRASWLERFVVGPFLFALPTVYRQGGLFFTAIPWAFVIAWHAARGRRRPVILAFGVLLLASLTFAHGISNFAVRKMLFHFLPTWVSLVVSFAAMIAHFSGASRMSPRKALALAAVTMSLTVDGLVPPFARAAVVAAFLLSWVLPALAAHRMSLAPAALLVLVHGDEGKAASALSVFALAEVARRSLERVPVQGRRCLRAFSAMMLAWLMCWDLFGCRASGIDFAYFLAFLPEHARIEDSWAANAATTLALHLGLAGAAAELVGDFDPMVVLRLIAGRCLLLGAFLVGFTSSRADFGPMRIADVVQEALVPVVVFAAVALAAYGVPQRTRRTEPAT